MSISFRKEFKEFEDGILNLLSMVPDLKYYIGNKTEEKAVILELLDVIKEDIPFVTNDNYPNTFSFTISAREVGFKTDDGYAFGWRVWVDKNSNRIIGYQFRITFINLSRSRKSIVEELISNGWKEKSSEEIQSKFWDEIDTSSRIPANEKEINVIKEEEIQPKTDIDVQVISSSNEEEKDYAEILPLPTFDYVDKDTEENNIQEKEEINVKQEKNVFLEPPRRGLLRPLSKAFKRNIVEVEDVQQTESIEEDIHEMAEAQTILETPKQVILPNGKVTETTKYLENNNKGLTPLDPEQYNIRPTDRPDKVIITFEGKEVPINVNESTRGIIRDPANQKLIIDTVVYDYKSFKVFGLPNDYRPDQAIFISATRNMVSHGPLPDEMFVPQETIMKNSDIDIEAIQEEAIKRENYQTKLTGVKPSINWNRNSVLNNNSNRNVLRKGKGFVIERSQPIISQEGTENQTQSVQISNEEGSMFEGRGLKW